jgi:hypothetical protein
MTDDNQAAPPDFPVHPSDILLEMIVAFLAPMFMTAACHDYRFARLAAMETMACYGARTQAELLNIAMIIGYSLTALDSLCLSMGDDLSLSMKLRLRSGANAANRSAQQNQRTLDQRQQQDPPPDFVAIPEAEIEAAIARTRTKMAQPAPLSPTVTEEETKLMWASAMANVAGELTRDLPNVAPDQRRSNQMWAEALGQHANAITAQAVKTPAAPPTDRSTKPPP